MARSKTQKTNPTTLGQRLATIKTYISSKRLPLTIILLALLGVSLVAAQFTRAEEVETPPVEQAATVETLDLTSWQPQLDLTVVVEDESSTTLIAQTPGVVSNIYLTAGANINAYQTLVRLSSTYTGGSQAALTKDIAKLGLDQATISLSRTSESVSQARAIADANRDNTQKLADIANQSLAATEEIIKLSQKAVADLESQIALTVDPQTKQTLEGQLIGLKASLLQTKTGYDNAKYANDRENPPGQLSRLSRDSIYTQTQLQLEMARIGRQIAELNYQAAALGESLTRVSAPYAGKVEAIFVNVGDSVNPGTPIARISRGQKSFSLKASLSGQVASLIKPNSSARLELPYQTIEVPLKWISTTSVQGNLYQLSLDLPASYYEQIYPGQTLRLQAPLIGSSTNRLVPLTSVYVTSRQSFVYVVEENRAATRVVELGQIRGTQIEILSGLTGDETLIVSRNISEGQLVETN